MKEAVAGEGTQACPIVTLSPTFALQKCQEDPGKPTLVTGPQRSPFLASPVPSSPVPTFSLTLEAPVIP